MPTSWRDIQRENFTRLPPLCDFLQLSEPQRQQLLPAAHFPLNLPRRLAAKMTKGTLDDPLARQWLPLQQELHRSSKLYSLDPVEDRRFQVTPRLLHKYSARVLLLTTGACAMNCRYCFRQNYEYERAEDRWSQELDWIAHNPEIEEVILSGGDPLSLSNDTLLPLLSQLDAISHLKRLRLHTRFPIGIPERIDTDLLKATQNLRLPLWVVLHINHPRELDPEIFAALKSWRCHGALVLSQSVLLQGVNDDLSTLLLLCKSLIDQGITPYYLHQLDRVEGASHFEVPLQKGIELLEQLQKQLPGYGVPRYVQEIPGRACKTPLT